MIETSLVQISSCQYVNGVLSHFKTRSNVHSFDRHDNDLLSLYGGQGLGGN